MHVFRLTRKKYGLTLSGKGASKYGARWNSPGVEMVYVAQSRALAVTEILVHYTAATVPSDFVMLETEIPDDLAIQEIDVRLLPHNWNSLPPTTLTQRLGDAFVEQGESAFLKVPSAVVEGDFNFLINLRDSDSQKLIAISQKDFQIDGRLF